jgi:heavy metal translocating P-type ATPase
MGSPGTAAPAAAPSASRSKELLILAGSGAGIGLALVFQYVFGWTGYKRELPLWIVLALGGIPLLYNLAKKLLRREAGADLLAGISIVTAAILGENLAGALVVLMLSSGVVLENYAVGRASGALRALAKRAPTIAHRRRNGTLEDAPLPDVQLGDILVVFPHEICPVDGTVVEGAGSMDESYLTGEPFEIRKTPGSDVISGAVNGESALSIRATRLAADSRYAKIMKVMRDTEEKRPKLRRLADRLGALYTPVALAIAVAAALIAKSPVRFLSVIVIATPCPLLIAIPVAIIGAITLAARRSIIIRDPAVMEQIESVRTIIFDKTGTLTVGAPKLADQVVAAGVDRKELLRLAASLEQYSKHPLAGAIQAAAKEEGSALEPATEMSEPPGEGLRGKVGGHEISVTGRGGLGRRDPARADALPPAGAGLECVLLLDGRYAGLYRFRDAPRSESRPFVLHLGPKHRFDRVLLVSGDRESEVAYLAGEVGITEIHAGKKPEEKVEIVKEETKKARTLFLGDGINDAPALLAATVGVAFGQRSDVTAEAAGAVIMEASLRRVDEFFHISRRMRAIALGSALGGMILSAIGMLVAAGGWLPPVWGALAQEAIDVLAVLNALRVMIPPRELSDF